MKGKTHHKRGQSFTELAIFMPILILLLAGMVEVTFLFNDYLQMLDAVRNGSRESSDSDPFPGNVDSAPPSAVSGAYDDYKDCSTTQNFFRRTGCNTNDGLGPLKMNLSTPYSGAVVNTCNGTGQSATFQDDIVISIFSIARVGASGSETLELKRYDNNQVSGGVGQLVEDTNQSGWSLMDDFMSTSFGGVGNMCSAVTIAQITTRLSGTNIPLVPNTAFVLVEVFKRHYQLFNVPGFGDVIPNPIPVVSYAIFPLVSAEPTPTP
ncbi:MAG: pilus assembly protein [Chloroflexi bacterium]|nr:pilus assembly protein [Chloroflexota bacterium]